MKLIAITLPLLLVLTVACAATPARENAGDGSAGHGQGRDSYSYSATQSTDTNFDYAQVSREELFDFKTLRMKFKNQVNEDNQGLVFVVDVNIANSGSKNFEWGDFTPYLGIKDEHGDWSYRMLFTQSAVRNIEPRKPVNIRYHAELRGERLPQQYVIVLQSMFGGRDVGFAFANPSRNSN